MQDSKNYRIVAEYGSVRRIIKINSSIRLPLKDLVLEAFSIEISFTCLLKSLKAEVVESQNNSIEEEKNNAPEESKIEEDQLTDIKDLKIKEKDLLSVLNLWAKPLKFHLCFAEGIKFLVKGAKRTVRCSADKCPFRFFFFSCIC